MGYPAVVDTARHWFLECTATQAARAPYCDRLPLSYEQLLGEHCTIAELNIGATIISHMLTLRRI